MAAEPIRHDSSVGPVVDVGTATNAKLRLSGLGHLIFSGVPGATALWLLGSVAIDRARGVRYADNSDLWIAGFVGVPMLLFAWPFFATAVRRFRAVGGGWYLRVGSGGIAFRLPGKALWSSALFGQRILEGTAQWARITKWYPFVIRMNGVATASTIVFHHADGWALNAETIYFAEPRERLVENITAARALSIG